MKNFIQKLVQLRNPHFVLPASISTGLLWRFAFQQLLAALRGCQVVFSLRSPKFMLRGKRVQFFNLPRIQWGRFFKIGNDVYISALGSGAIVMGDNVSIGAFSRIIISTSLDNPGLFIRIGNNVGIGEFTYMGGAGGLIIGDDCIIGQYFSCHPENHYYSNTEELIRLQGVNRRGIIIGKNCWIGSKVTILDGTTIGDGCVIAAGTVVNKSFPDNVVIGGVPGKILRYRSASVADEAA